MQNDQPHPRLTESETGVKPCNLFYQGVQVLLMGEVWEPVS